ncbi:adenosine kinase [Sphingomonas histidinilytica]|jgi:sugar/nucleoside kinase (ribokinase family)|uniref:Sugar or nucleoside kinase, ribokinase family n=1 Tax=Rhizorhabdus histidinilytica TaxID=439228 RepID=A0A1T5A0K7_9SPHN|nr:adenosine kinase [Rhizorhabdus histidinilytica]MBO9376034.1 adenosine kinase [Rhizorhabdus histidinilytica]QEH78453.1 adenosine kinase [Sphingomonas sp. C8-2]SKB28307.1 Sugar or nucleoside kinase, ribokinase family [Rhizorhabdus histidinilytica]
MTEATIDVVGIGNAIIDLLAHAEDSFLTEHQLNKGAMTLIDEPTAERLYAAMGPATRASGGSAGNTIAGLGSLGASCGYIGKLRDDELGAAYRHDLLASGVRFTTPMASDGPSTARCIIFVTSDAERTMNTYLGACVNLTPDDIDEALVGSAKITYLEGYLYDEPHAKAAFHRAADIAHGAGRKVALTLSDAFCVLRHRADFLDLIRDRIDILFANKAELLALFETEDLDAALDRVAGMVELAAVTLSAEGSVVVRGTERVRSPAAHIERVVDTTGAGDLYAAGFLYGLTRGLPLAECARIAGLAAAEIISHFGARPEVPLREFAGLD